MEISTLSDPARFAQSIRDLARDAHWTLGHSPTGTALRRLSRRIELLGSALGDGRSGPIGDWLESLGREVRSAAIRRAGSSLPGCLCASMDRSPRQASGWPFPGGLPVGSAIQACPSTFAGP